jgi:hypothetical protein
MRAIVRARFDRKPNRRRFGLFLYFLYKRLQPHYRATSASVSCCIVAMQRGEGEGEGRGRGRKNLGPIRSGSCGDFVARRTGKSGISAASNAWSAWSAASVLSLSPNSARINCRIPPRPPPSLPRTLPLKLCRQVRAPRCRDYSSLIIRSLVGRLLARIRVVETQDSGVSIEQIFESRRN